jgi:hypothetical protein
MRAKERASSMKTKERARAMRTKERARAMRTKEKASSMKIIIKAAICVILAAAAVFLLTACQLTVKPPVEKEGTDDGLGFNGTPQLTVDGVGFTGASQLTLAVLPDLPTAQKIEVGMSYHDVLELMGQPTAFIGGSSEDGEVVELAYIWTFVDEGGYAEVTISVVDDPVVSGIFINESFIQSAERKPVATPAPGSDVELVVTECEWGDGSVAVHYELANPKPFDISIDNEIFYLNGEELSHEEYLGFSLWADPNSIRGRDFILKKPITADDILVITGVFKGDYTVLGTAEFTILFGSGSAEVASSLLTIPFDTVKDGLEAICLGWKQEEEYVELHYDLINSNPFSVYRRDETIFFNGEELSRLDWSSTSPYAYANSTGRGHCRVYRKAEPGDRIDIRWTLDDKYTGKTQVLEFGDNFLSDDRD